MLSDAGAIEINYYIGRAAEDLPDDDAILKVIISSITPALEGGVSASDSDNDVETVDDDGVMSTVKAKTTNFIEAIYIGKTNDKYPPSVRKGEQVLIYEYSDSDRYYWESLGRENPTLRTREIKRIEIASKPDIQAALDENNSYYIELDSKDKEKAFTIRTSKADGEISEYLFRINTKDGYVLLTDSKMNTFYLNTEEEEISMTTASNAVTRLIKDCILITAPRDLAFVAGQDIYMKAGRDFVVIVGRDKKVTIGRNHTVNVGKSINETIGSSKNVTVPLYAVEGKMTVSESVTSPAFHGHADSASTDFD